MKRLANSQPKPPKAPRYQVMVPIGRHGDRMDVVDSQAERPTRAILCTTNRESAKRIVAALNSQNK